MASSSQFEFENDSFDGWFARIWAATSGTAAVVDVVVAGILVVLVVLATVVGMGVVVEVVRTPGDSHPETKSTRREVRTSASARTVQQRRSLAGRRTSNGLRDFGAWNFTTPPPPQRSHT
jgi:hypothetical protein